MQDTTQRYIFLKQHSRDNPICTTQRWTIVFDADSTLNQLCVNSSCLLGDKKEINRALGHICAHTGQIGPREAPEDVVMSEMTLPSRHRSRNSNPGGLRPSTLPLGHGSSPQYLRMVGEENCCFF